MVRTERKGGGSYFIDNLLGSDLIIYYKNICTNEEIYVQMNKKSTAKIKLVRLMVDCANSHASITCTDVHFLYFTNFLIPLENYWFFREKNVFFEFGNFLKFTAIKLREKNLEKKSFPTHLRISGSSPGLHRVYRVGFSGSIYS
jgi:hypothetical protein